MLDLKPKHTFVTVRLILRICAGILYMYLRHQLVLTENHSSTNLSTVIYILRYESSHTFINLVICIIHNEDAIRAPLDTGVSQRGKLDHWTNLPRDRRTNLPRPYRTVNICIWPISISVLEINYLIAICHSR